MDALLRADQVSFCYPGLPWRLSEISLSVSGGEIVGVIGPNGSGKSTLVKILAGILHPDEGAVWLRKKIVSSLPRKKLAQQVGYLPQTTSWEFDYTVDEVVAMGRFCHSQGVGILGERDRKIVDECLTSTHLEPLVSRRISTLSGGERRRVFLASVLAQQPQLMILDEPTTGLDIHHQVELLSLLRRFARKGMGIVLVTHEINLAALYAGKLVLLDRGRLVGAGKPPKVLRSNTFQQVYGAGICLGEHPQRRIPVVLPDITDE